MGLRDLACLNIETTPVSFKIYKYLVEAIINGDFEGGERVVEADLAELLGVSRQPIRDALRILEIDGLVKLTPYRGAMVTSLTPQDVKQTLEVKAMVEGFAAWKSAQSADAEKTAELKSTLKEMKSHIDKNNFKGVLHANLRFHRLMVDNLGNERLSRYYERIDNFIRRLYTIGLSSRPNWENSLSEHYQILKSIEKKDATLAEQAARNHALHSIDRVLSALK